MCLHINHLESDIHSSTQLPSEPEGFYAAIFFNCTTHPLIAYFFFFFKRLWDCEVINSLNYGPLLSVVPAGTESYLFLVSYGKKG